MVRRGGLLRVFLLVAYGSGAWGCDDDGSGPGPGDGNGDVGSITLALQVVARGLNDPVFLTSPSGDPRLFVVEQAGRIRIIQNGQLLALPFLDITDSVLSGNERGLLSVAFHPQYASNGFFFVNYTRVGDGATMVKRYSVSGAANAADANSGKQILIVVQPASNHNGGLNAFGPDGMLYIGLGDGGGSGDGFQNGQDSTTLLGTLLRIDIDAGDPFAVPADNPFVGRGGADEVWAYGLRNPWRFAFDRQTGDLYIADVGQNQSEEVNVASGTAAGLNYGWNIMEGFNCFQATNCDMSGLTPPVLEYSHAGGNCSVTGGYVYRGNDIPELVGHYFYADFCTGFLRSFRFTGTGIADEREWNVGALNSVSSFGEDADGELYILSLNGDVNRLVEQVE